MDDAKNMDYCGLGYIVKGVKKMKRRRTNTTSSTAVENDIRNDSFHTLLSKLNIVEKKLEKLDKSLPMVAEGVCSVGLDGSKLKVELPGNWVDILREYEASGSRPCLEVSFIRDLNKESPTQDLAGVGCLGVAKGSMPGINAKSCSCEKAIQKEKMDVLFENDATLGTSVLLSQSVRKQSNPLRAFSEDITGIPFVPRGSDRSCPSLVSKIQRALSRSKLNYVIPAPLRDESEPSTTSVMSAPADCHSCGFPWKVLFDSTDSSHTHHCRVHSNPPGCEHSQVNVFEEAVISSSNEAKISARTQFQNMDTERVLPPVQPQEEFVRAGATKSCELIAAEENTEFEGQGELQEANLVNTDDPELIKRDASPRFLLPRLDFVRPGIQRPSNFVPEMSVSTTTFQTASIGHPISRLFIDEGTVLSSHPSDPLDPPRGTAANPNGDRVKKGMFISITPYEGTPKHLKSPSKNETFDEQLQEKSAVNPSHSETPGTPEPSPTVGISIQERIEPTSCSKPLNFDSGELAEFPVNYNTELNDIDNEKDSDFESTLVEEFINGAMMESLLSHLASKPTYNDDDLYNATSELLRKSHETAIVHEDHFIKNTLETKSKYMSSRSEVLRGTKFRQSLRSQLVMALRVDNDRPKNLCVGKMARALMDSKNERTRRWIEEIPHKWVVGSRTKLNRLPSPKRDRNSKKGSIKNIRIINSMLATSDISMRKRNTGTVVVRPDYARRHRKVSGSYRRHHSSSPDRTTLKGKHHRRRKHSQVIGSVKNSEKTTENLRGNAQSDEVLDKPLKILLPGMCIMGAFEKAKNKFRNKRVNSTSVHAKDKPGYPKETNDGDNNAKDTKNKMKSTHDYRRSHRMNTSSAKHPITMPVSQVRIVDHRHRRGFTNRESEKDDEEYTNVNGRFGERCKHPDCEKQRSPASFSDMLSRTRALRLERNADRRKQARHSQHQRQSSSEDSVIYQRLPGLKDRAKEHYRPRRVENVHYRRGYLLDSLPGRRNQSQEEEGDDHNFEHRDQYINNNPQHRRDYEHRLSRNHQHHHNRDHHKPKPARVKRRALLRESSSSSSSSSEALVISRPNTQSPIPKPRPKVDFIETKPRVTLPRNNARYAVESVEPSRFHRAYQKESHVRKHHAPLVRDILRLNRQIHHPSGLHKNAETKRNNKDSSESAPSSESEEYAHNRYDKSAPEKTREGNIYQAHARAKSFANSGAKKGLRLMERLSQRRLESSDSKSSAGYDQINVKDFVDFLVTLSRNTVGTLTNKRKAMSLYKSYLNGEYKTGRVDKGDLVSRIKKAHHRQK